MAGEEENTLQENAARLALFALEMQHACAKMKAPDGSPVVMRIGLHAGPVVGGIVGGNMLRYQFSAGCFLLLFLHRTPISRSKADAASCRLTPLPTGLSPFEPTLER